MFGPCFFAASVALDGWCSLIWLHRDSPHLFGIDNCFLSVDMQNKPCSVPSSVGTKGLECSPSTPTMNSYFYKFMINLLKRFSSERKLLEVRGAFIIRSVLGASLLPQPRVSSSRHARGRGSHGLSARPVCDGCRKREKPGEEAEKRGLRGRKKPRREGDAGSLEGQEAGRSLLSAAGSGRGVASKETGEPQGESGHPGGGQRIDSQEETEGQRTGRHSPCLLGRTTQGFLVVVGVATPCFPELEEGRACPL